MFFKGSRYRELPQSPHLTARGESLLGVDIRFIPDVSGEFLHTVSDRERLDLLAFKSYGDDRRWWLIADANRDVAAFPLDLLDLRPIVQEEVAVVHPDLAERTTRLIGAIRELVPAVVPAEEIEHMGLGDTRLGDVWATVAVAQYTAATTRAVILQRIAAEGFRLLTTNTWTGPGGLTAEAFTFADEHVKASWNDLIARLAAEPGVVCAESRRAAERLRVRYNTAQVGREVLMRSIEQRGFREVPELSRVFERLGTSIVIPPNQAA